MSKEATEAVGRVAFLGITLASTSMLVQAATSVQKQAERMRMETLRKRQPQRKMEMPSVSDAIFGRKKRK
jgi:50S ribosomal subunit-associated GTPase HflX